jgi:predicted nucleic acid-binding protein
MTALNTNVLVYACDTADPAKQQRALQIIEDTRDGVLLWQVACEFLAASRKLVAQGFTPGQAWARLTEFLELFPLVLPSAELLDRARELHVNRNLSFWDAMIIGACLDCGANRLFSEDVPSTARFGDFEVINPFA